MAINYRSHFAYRIDAWDADGENVIEHLAGVEDLQVAKATVARLLRAGVRRKKAPAGGGSADGNADRLAAELVRPSQQKPPQAWATTPAGLDMRSPRRGRPGREAHLRRMWYPYLRTGTASRVCPTSDSWRIKFAFNQPWRPRLGERRPRVTIYLAVEKIDHSRTKTSPHSREPRLNCCKNVTPVTGVRGLASAPERNRRFRIAPTGP
jgi:hypothetical protein